MSRVWDDSLNPYEVLSLENGIEATEADIKKAYRKLAKQKHPDKNPGANVEEFHLIQTAYEILCDADAKAAYDQLLKARFTHEARLGKQSEKRRKMREDLESKEREHHQERQTEMKAQVKLHQELDRLRKKMEHQHNSKVNIKPSLSSSAAQDLSNVLKVKWELRKREKPPTESDLLHYFERWVKVKALALRVKGRICSAVLELFDSNEVTHLLELQQLVVEGKVEDGCNEDLLKFTLSLLESHHSSSPRIIVEEPGNKESTKLTFDISETEVLEKLRSFGKRSTDC